MSRNPPRVALVFPRMATGELGGAEVLRSELHAALSRCGVAAELVEVTCDEQDFPAVLRSYSRCYDLNLDEFDLVISTKAPTFMVRHRNHVSLLVHTLRVFYDRFGTEFPRAHRGLLAQRERIHALDLEAFSGGLIRRRFTIGDCVWQRLVDVDERWRDLPFEEVTLPPRMLPENPSPRGAHFLLPGRLHRWKRVDLAIRAVRAMDGDTPLHITGTGEDEPALREAAAGDPRIVFHGRVSDEELDDLFRGSLAVPFVPVEEDFGFVTVEAFAHGVPVVTCTDSGRPASIVAECGGGVVVAPEPGSIAAALDELRASPERARELGRRGRELAETLTWDGLARTLLEAGGIPPAATDPGDEGDGGAEAGPREPVTLGVIDNQPIEPPVGGGRLRLYGLYRTLDPDTRAIYVGSYDWRGPGRRVLHHPPQLEERTIPHSPEHFEAAEALQERCGGQSVIDVSQPILAHLSTEYLDECRRALAEAQVAVFSHPWLYPPLADDVRRLGLPVVYDSQNMEWKLRRGLLGGTAMGRALAESVRFWEGALCRNADLVLACSEDDAAAFVEEYGIARDRIEIVPNGVDVRAIVPGDAEAGREARRHLKLAAEDFVAVFIGSAYGPNVDAARWIVEELAPASPGTTFLVVGGVGSTVPRSRPRNVRVTGEVDDEGRLHCFHAADVAVNPIPFGSGTNIKMFDFMAAGLPIVSSPSGARGLGDPGAFLVREPEAFAAEIEALRKDPERRLALGRTARSLACERYDWAAISARVATLGRGLADRSPVSTARRVRRGPAVSVVVPSYARPEGLRELVGALARQTMRDFEILVIEQGTEKTDLEAPAGLRLRHVFTPVRGAVRARNTGLRLAGGEIVAFTDDDCLPDPTWLEAVLETVQRPGAVGVEGLVAPDRQDADPRSFRIVTNQGFEGMGFMTANLAVRRRLALEAGGFDEIFDHPHFREDTDLAWRLASFGSIPFSSEARVVHPVLPRSDPRESVEARTRFFEKDPLLFEKHPRRYVSLFVAEDHYRKTPGFWEAFRRGVEKYGTRLEARLLADSGLVQRECLPAWFVDQAGG